MGRSRRGVCVGVGAVAAGLLVTRAALGPSKARRPARGVGTPPGWSAALLPPLAALWLAAGIVDSIAGALGGLVSRPIDWARSLVQGVVSWISDWLNHVIDWAGTAFDAINGVLGHLWDFGNSIVTWANGVITNVWDRLVGWVGGLVQGVRNWVTDWVNHVIDWISGLVGDLWSYAKGTVDWVNQNVWRPLNDAISGAIDWVQTSVIPWAGRIVDDLRGWAVSAFDHLWGWIGGTLQPWLGWAEGLLHAVEKAFGWLVWIGEHPLDWFRSLWRDWTGLDSKNTTAALVDAMGRESDLVADYLIRWLG